MDVELVQGKVRWIRFLVANARRPGLAVALQEERRIEAQNPSGSQEIRDALQNGGAR